MWWIRSICGLLVCTLPVALSGCASTQEFPETEATTTTGINEGAAGWWYARFRINRSRGGIRWHLDGLLANEVIAPILKQHKQDIPVWRFHRRAADDSTGHQFSFIFYASPRAAAAINSKLVGSRLYSELKGQGIIQQLLVDKTDKVLRPQMIATSDKKWSVPLQESWPFYIMGVSKIWLGLIEQYSVQHGLPKSVTELTNHYLEVHKKVTQVWRKQGRHAFLHHLNAMFGYEPMEMYEHRLINF